MSYTIVTILSILATAIAVSARIFFYLKGKDSAKLKRAEKVLDDVKKGNAAAANPDYDDRLREKYGKK